MMITNKDKLDCAERELRFRYRVFDRAVVRGSMTKQQMDREIELMSAIAEDYRALCAGDDPDFAMFIETRKTVRG